MTKSQANNDAGEKRNPSKTVAPGLLPALKGAVSDWSAHKSAKAGAAIAYYSIFSIGPLIVVVISLAALFLGREGVQKEVTESIRGLLGAKGSEAVNAMLTSAGAPSEGVFASIIGTVTLVFAAIGVVVQLKEALNVVWEVKPKAGGGLWGFVRSYVLSLAGVVTVGFLLLVSMLLTAGLSAFAQTFGTFIPESLMHAGEFLFSFAAISVLFILMFKWLPDAPVEWRDVWLGGVATAALFDIGKFLIGLYIGKQGLESTYGASASIVVVLIWVYYSAQIVLFGAEFTHVRARQRAPAATDEDDDWRGTARDLRLARRRAGRERSQGD
jgi:membrane protein